MERPIRLYSLRCQVHLQIGLGIVLNCMGKTWYQVGSSQLGH